MSTNAIKTQEMKKPDKEYTIVRSYPETLFFYPSMIIALLSFIIQAFLPDLFGTDTELILGTFFFAVFAFNFIIVAFDFGVGKTALIAFGVIIFVLVYILLITQFPELKFGFSWPNITVSQEFYLFFFLLIAIHLVIMYIYSRIDYWLISPTEIYHHRGILGDEERFGNAQHAHIEKANPDIFEKMLFLSGDLFIKPETGDRIYRISNVFRINKKEDQIRRILSYVPDKRLEF